MKRRKPPMSNGIRNSSDTSTPKDIIRPDNSTLRQWTSWAGAGVRTVAEYFTGPFRHDLPAQCSPPTNPVLDIAASTPTMLEMMTVEKYYRINDGGRVLKRSLRQDEYETDCNSNLYIPPLVIERLKNEATCMTFISRNTDIPVPKLLETYEKDGCYHLWMEYVDGIAMSELSKEDQLEILPQVESAISTLQNLRSRFSGGPTGILSPPNIVYHYHFAEWEQQISSEEEFVFCHGDLSQHNILVDPKTLQIVAIIDWEYSGFFPRNHEIPFFQSSEFSGIQVKDRKFKPAVDKMIGFWRQSQKPAS